MLKTQSNGNGSSMISEILAGKRKVKTVSVRLPGEILEQIDKHCKEKGLSRQQILEDFIERGLHKLSKEAETVMEDKPRLKPTILGDPHAYNTNRFLPNIQPSREGGSIID